MGTFYSKACQQEIRCLLGLGIFFHIKTVMKGAFNLPKRISAKTKASKEGMPRHRGNTRCEKTPQTVYIINEPVYYNMLTTDWILWYIYIRKILVMMFELV